MKKGKADHSIIKPWYAEIQKQLKSHFKSVKSLEEAAKYKSDKDGDFLQKVNQTVRNHMHEEGFSAASLAQAMALSPSQLFRRVKDLTQMSPGRYIRYVRLVTAKQLLESGQYNVSEAACEVGFISVSHFTRVFQEQFHFKPSSLKP